MNALLVYPKFPPSYWSFQFALEFVGKKSAMPPLGLLTVAGLFPEHYRLRLVDMNTRPLTDEDLQWADVVFTSTMIVQKDSLQEVVGRCHEQGLKVVAGGPHPTSFYEDLQEVDHLILGEVEEVLPRFLEDLESGTAGRIYRGGEKPRVSLAPLPRFDLISLEDYGSMALQFSRGCPFDCEFCDITQLFGRFSRTKSAEQMLQEFNLLYQLGWRGNVFLVDDNFIGNKREAMRLLPELSRWQEERGFPFSLFTEASVNLARQDRLMESMVEAGFSMVFLGIETPNEAALLKTNKKQNTKKGEGGFLLNAVRRIQNMGMEVSGGFILGLDGDGPEVFESQVRFIQEAGIPFAMTGLLSALKGTRLYDRMEREGRLLEESSGNNVSIGLNFKTEIDPEVLISGYKKVLTTLYDSSLKNYFQRCSTMLKHLRVSRHLVRPVGRAEVLAVIRSVRAQLFSRQGLNYLRFIIGVLSSKPWMFPEAVRMAIMGYHFEKFTHQQIAVYNFKVFLDSELEYLRRWLSEHGQVSCPSREDVRTYSEDLACRVRSRYNRIHQDFRYAVNDALDSFGKSVQHQVEQFCGTSWPAIRSVS